MFNRIAGVYDRMNHVMTAGLDRRWRQRAVDRAGLSEGSSALDVCRGTGDLAFELARGSGPRPRRRLRRLGADAQLARDKEEDLRLGGTAAAPDEFEWADALELPYADASFDAVTVGFGVRNLSDLDAGLAELTRVLKPGGRLVIWRSPSRSARRCRPSSGCGSTGSSR